MEKHMRGHLSFETAYSIFKVIHESTPADFDALGITEAAFNVTSGKRPWLRPDLQIVMRTINALTFGTLEVMGMPKLVVPAEYQAALIAAFIAPANRMTACVWLSQERQTGAGALELAARGNQGSKLEPASADQLFALVCILSNQDYASQARKAFRTRLGLAKEQAEALVQ